MKVGDKVVLSSSVSLLDVEAFSGRVGVIQHVYSKGVWDDPEVAEFSVDFGVFFDSEGNFVDASELFFTETELLVVS